MIAENTATRNAFANLWHYRTHLNIGALLYPAADYIKTRDPVS
jgi:hypothetical protein